MSTLAQLDLRSPIATLTLNRPDARNALSLDLLDALHARLDELTAHLSAGPDAANSPRVLRISAAGPSFCAGMDLKQVLNDPEKPHTLLSSLADLCLKIRSLPLVTIAAVHGAAIGGGCGLVTACDFAVTHEQNKLGFPEVDLGVCPAVVAPWLVRKIGPGKARMVLLRGGLMTGTQAHELGLVSACVPTAADVPTEARALADRIAAGGPNALRATKHLLNELDGSLDRALGQRAADLSASVLKDPATLATLRAKLGM